MTLLGCKIYLFFKYTRQPSTKIREYQNESAGWLRYKYYISTDQFSDLQIHHFNLSIFLGTNSTNLSISIVIGNQKWLNKIVIRWGSITFLEASGGWRLELSKNWGGVEVHSVHDILHAIGLVSLPGQVFLVALDKFVFGLQTALSELPKAVAIVESNDVMAMSKDGMKRLWTKNWT